MAAVGEEGTAGNEGHLLFQALHLKLLGVHIFRQHHPGEQAAYRVGEGAALGSSRSRVSSITFRRLS